MIVDSLTSQSKIFSSYGDVEKSIEICLSWHYIMWPVHTSGEREGVFVQKPHPRSQTNHDITWPLHTSGESGGVFVLQTLQGHRQIMISHDLYIPLERVGEYLSSRPSKVTDKSWYHVTCTYFGESEGVFVLQTLQGHRQIMISHDLYIPLERVREYLSSRPSKVTDKSWYHMTTTYLWREWWSICPPAPPRSRTKRRPWTPHCLSSSQRKRGVSPHHRLCIPVHLQKHKWLSKNVITGTVC